jgi:ribosomal protein L28
VQIKIFANTFPINARSFRCAGRDEDVGVRCSTSLRRDKRRFRANVYVDPTSSDGFAEDQFVARSLRIGQNQPWPFSSAMRVA